MKRMTKEYEKVFDLVAQRDGLRCFVGREELGREFLVLVPWDTDWMNNSASNWMIVCERMSQLFGWSRHHRKRKQEASNSSSVCERIAGSPDELPSNTSLEYLKHLRADPAFNHWWFEETFRRVKIPYKEVLNGGAYIANVTQKTSREYIDKQISPQGMYRDFREGDERFLALKPEWETFRKKIEDRKTLARQGRNWLKDRIDGLQISTSKPGHKRGHSDSDPSSKQRPPKEEPPP